MTEGPFAPRCTKCGNACEASHYDPVPLVCPRGHRFDGSWPTHGEKRTVVLSWRSLMRGDWLQGLMGAAVASSVTGWAGGFVCILVCGVGISALPILLNAVLRRRLGMHHPPKVRSLPT